jgi:hypothetical protein
MVHPIVNTYRDLLNQAQGLMQKADLTQHKLTRKAAPHVGGDFDVKDSWESVVYPLVNQHGVSVNLSLQFRIRDGDNIAVDSCASAWCKSADRRKPSVHSGSTREMDGILYHHQLGKTGLSDLISEALTIAALIKPAHVSGGSWANVVIPDPADADDE